jgi:hypothetical protein
MDPTNITEANIESLRTEAGEAGDMLQVIYCDIALGRDPDDWMVGQCGVDAIISVDGARAKCAQALAWARAQQEEV